LSFFAKRTAPRFWPWSPQPTGRLKSEKP